MANLRISQINQLSQDLSKKYQEAHENFNSAFNLFSKAHIDYEIARVMFQELIEINNQYIEEKKKNKWFN
jgi:hypothetical protein